MPVKKDPEHEERKKLLRDFPDGEILRQALDMAVADLVKNHEGDDVALEIHTRHRHLAPKDVGKIMIHCKGQIALPTAKIAYIDLVLRQLLFNVTNHLHEAIDLSELQLLFVIDTT